MSHGLSCEVCKYKVHKRCEPKAINNCKWTTLASVGKEIIEDKDGVCAFVSNFFISTPKNTSVTFCVSSFALKQICINVCVFLKILYRKIIVVLKVWYRCQTIIFPICVSFVLCR